MSNIIIAAPLAAVRRRTDLILNLRAASWAAAICMFAAAMPAWASGVEIGSHEVVQLQRLGAGDATAGGSTGLPVLDQSTDFARLTPDDFVIEEEIAGGPGCVADSAWTFSRARRRPGG